jgi:hypothetical protein
MDGDCGHGWGYHEDASSPCQKCVEEDKKEKNERTKDTKSDNRRSPKL